MALENVFALIEILFASLSSLLFTMEAWHLKPLPPPPLGADPFVLQTLPAMRLKMTCPPTEGREGIYGVYVERVCSEGREGKEGM